MKVDYNDVKEDYARLNAEISSLTQELEEAKAFQEIAIADNARMIEKCNKYYAEIEQLKQSPDAVVMPEVITDVLRNSYNAKALACEIWTVDDACRAVEQFCKALTNPTRG